jgi:hypothetical protein
MSVLHPDCHYYELQSECPLHSPGVMSHNVGWRQISSSQEDGAIQDEKGHMSNEVGFFVNQTEMISLALSYDRSKTMRGYGIGNYF